MRRNERGFSLIELMIVVAIVGALAAIAQPSYNYFVAKARQTEGKNCLTNLYSAEQTFHNQWDTYTSSFQLMGYTPRGYLNYRCGQVQGGGDFATNTSNGLPGNYPEAGNSGTNDMNTAWYCAGFPANCTCGDNCAPTLSGEVLTQQDTFIREARSLIDQYGVADVWRIDQLKQMTNLANGL